MVRQTPLARTIFCPRLKNVSNCNGFFVPDSKMLQIVTVFCPRFKNAPNCNGFFVPDSKMQQIVMVFLSPTQKWYKLQCFFCPRLKNATNCNVFFVPDTKMPEITMVFPPTAKPGVLDESLKADEWIDKIRIRRYDNFGVCFAHVYWKTQLVLAFLKKSIDFFNDFESRVRKHT